MFFSSPFGGLELEREELTKKYWPELQSLCSRHGYTFVPVDLRWGITSDLSANASTIKICLSEIDRSDIFVGFFGQVDLVAIFIGLYNILESGKTLTESSLSRMDSTG